MEVENSVVNGTASTMPYFVLVKNGIVPKLGNSLVQLVLLTMLITGQTEIHICVSMDGLEIL